MNYAILLRLAASALTVLLACDGSSVRAQNYPSRSVRMIVPFAPGGLPDIMARIIAQKLSESLGQQVVVDNRTGAGGNIGMGIAAKAPADGHTILLTTSSFVVNPSLYAKVPYDPYRDFAPVTNAASSPNVIAVHPSLPAKSVKELAALVKSQPGKYSAASPGTGTTSHLSIELFKLTLGLDLVHVAFNGGAPALQSAIANQTPIVFTGLPPAVPHIKAGLVRALAVTTPRRSPALPDVPTLSEAGFAGQESDTLLGVLVPAGTPNAIVARLRDEIAKALAAPDAKERVAAIGYDIIASTPAEFAAQIKADITKWSKVIKAANIKMD
jgi:tripartite-type tricarboxylate transporter receptor subunit TctC